MLKIAAVFCVVLLAVDGAIVKRETTPAPNNILDEFQTNMDYLRNCVDHSVANVVGHVNEQQLKPVFNLVGETLNRVSKAFEDLTATTSGPSQIEK